MKQLFLSVLLLSAAGGGLTLLLLLLKPVTRRTFGAQWQYYIWLSVLLVLLLPVRFRLPAAPADATPAQRAVQSEQAAAQDAPDAEPPLKQAGVPPAGTRAEAPAVPIFPWLRLLSWLWLAGAAVFLCCGGISYLRFRRMIRLHSTPYDCLNLEQWLSGFQLKRRISVRATRMLSAPLMTGILHPVLLLPDREMTLEEIDCILRHELTHFRRHDLWYKWLAFFVNAVHWFNPLVYLAVRQINEECELSCDRAVTAAMSEADKAGYMRTILRLAAEN